MTDNLLINSHGRWLHLQAACDYLDLSTVTLAKKLNAGTGPKFYLSPGSWNKVFWTGDLDDWIRNSPERQPTPGERVRLAKLQEGAERVRQKRRARRQAQTDETDTA